MLSSMSVYDFSFMITDVAIVADKITSHDCTVDILQSFARNAVFVHLHLSSAAEQGAKALNSGVHGPKPQVIMLLQLPLFRRSTEARHK